MEEENGREGFLSQFVSPFSLFLAINIHIFWDTLYFPHHHYSQQVFAVGLQSEARLSESFSPEQQPLSQVGVFV